MKFTGNETCHCGQPTLVVVNAGDGEGAIYGRPWWLQILPSDQPGKFVFFCSAECLKRVADAVDIALEGRFL